MKRFLTLLLLIFWAMPTMAATSTAGEVLNFSEKIEDDFYAAGQSLSFQQPILGDLVIAGETLNVLATVEEDLTIAGATVNITAEVLDDIRAAGETILISGPVGGDVIAAGGSISQGPASLVQGDFWVWGDEIVLDGQINGDVKISARKVTIAGQLVGNADIVSVEPVNMRGDARIGGNLMLEAPASIEASRVGGVITFEQQSMPVAEKDIESFFAEILTGYAIFKFIVAALMGLLITWLVKRYAVNFAEFGREEFASNALVGLLTLVVTPIAILLLLITVIGWPLAWLGVLGYLLLMAVAKLMMGFLVGRLLIDYNFKSSFMKVWGAYLLGIVILYVLMIVPFIGWLIKFVIYIAAFGVASRLGWRFFLALRKGKQV